MTPAKNFNGDEAFEMTVSHNSVKGTAAGLNGSLNVDTDDKSWNMVNMSITDWSPSVRRMFSDS